MAGNSKYGFTAAQIDNPGGITAFVETWKEPNQKAGGFSEPKGTYGITWAGGGNEGILWGGGFARNPEPLIAEGLVRLLAEFSKPAVIHAHVHKEFWKHVAPGDGYVRRSSGASWSSKDYHGFKPLSEVAHALDEGRLRLDRQAKLGKPTTSSPRLVAHGLALTVPRAKIAEYRQRDPLALPSLGIVVEG
ncbi:hypothetical protein IG197_08965 [Aminobacter sp. SR38]|jgi:hypothetical protein|uniref:hypothetical protein n=1 Tax=Aminobacter sp. SR38 TaxID=2774562 RepID=UPI00177DAC2F|nr:hypothetical protein [Aminobacter sp. SR38]QOF73162.1 hypothetical protein IG197_08965 [Aminobacter sp. SR38]